LGVVDMSWQAKAHWSGVFATMVLMPAVVAATPIDGVLSSSR